MPSQADLHTMIVMLNPQLSQQVHCTHPATEIPSRCMGMDLYEIIALLSLSGQVHKNLPPPLESSKHQPTFSRKKKQST